MLDHEALAAAVEHDLLAVRDPAAPDEAALARLAATKSSPIGGASQKESVAPPAFTKRNRPVMPVKLIERGAARPGLLGGEHVDPRDAERDGEIAVVEEQQARSARRSTRDGAAAGRRGRRGCRRRIARSMAAMSSVAVDEGAGGVEHGARRCARAARPAGVSSSVISGWRAQVAGHRIDRVARALLRRRGRPARRRALRRQSSRSFLPRAGAGVVHRDRLGPERQTRKGRRRITSPPLAKRSSGFEALRAR